MGARYFATRYELLFEGIGGVVDFWYKVLRFKFNGKCEINILNFTITFIFDEKTCYDDFLEIVEKVKKIKGGNEITIVELNFDPNAFWDEDKKTIHGLVKSNNIFNSQVTGDEWAWKIIEKIFLLNEEKKNEKNKKKRLRNVDYI